MVLLSMKLILFGKRPIFSQLWQDVKLLPCSIPLKSNLALTWNLYWGTVWASISTGTGIEKYQNLNSWIYFAKFDLLWMLCHLRQKLIQHLTIKLKPMLHYTSKGQSMVTISHHSWPKLGHSPNKAGFVSFHSSTTTF